MILESAPLISVIITSYNYLRFIPQAIDSVRAQTYPNVEIVVSDNCSTDGTVPALRARYADDSRVRIFENETNIGELANSNRGFERSTGAFVIPLSADDWMYPHHLERLYQVFERAPELDIVYSGAYFADEGGTVYAQRMPTLSFPYDYVDARDELIEMVTATCPICWPTALFRRSVFLDVGLEIPEEGIHATDWEMQIRMALAGKRFGYLAEPSTALRIHPSQETGRLYHVGSRRFDDFLKIIEKYLDHPEFIVRTRGRERGIVGHLTWVHDDTVAASGPEVFGDRIEARFAAVVRTLEGRAAAYEPARASERTVSVLIAAARSPVLVARALASVAAQTHPNWEIVLVDHGRVPLRSLIDAHPSRDRISYVRAPAPLASGRAHNIGLRMARGEYLAFLDEGNTFAPEHLAALAAAIARSGGTAAAAASRLVLENVDERCLSIQPIGDVAIFRGPGDPPALSAVADALPLDAVLVYRSVLDRTGRFSETLELLDGYDFLLRVERDAPLAFANAVTLDVRASVDLASLGPHLPQYVAVLAAIHGAHPAPQLEDARIKHRAAVERTIGAIVAAGASDAQRTAELLATLAGYRLDLKNETTPSITR